MACLPPIDFVLVEFLGKSEPMFYSSLLGFIYESPRCLGLSTMMLLLSLNSISIVSCQLNSLQRVRFSDPFFTMASTPLIKAYRLHEISHMLTRL